MNTRVESKTRTSSSVFLPDGLTAKDSILRSIEQKCTLITGIPLKFWETLQLTRYEPGQQYRPHFDFFQGDKGEDLESNRSFTIFCYLNTLPASDGGQTHFTKQGLSIQPEQGNAVLWPGCSLLGTRIFCDPRTEHAGLPPTKGSKWGLNCWARTFPYR